jgi:gamma-tubulin complex component 2
LEYDPTKLDKLENVMAMFEETFAKSLRNLLNALNFMAATETVAFLNLCARLSPAGDGLIAKEET